MNGPKAAATGISEALQNAGLSAADVAALLAAEPITAGAFAQDRARYGAFWELADRLIARFPKKPARSVAEAKTVAAIRQIARAARERFLRAHVEALYTAITDGFS